MNLADLPTAEQAQIVHAQQMGGYLVDNLPDGDRQVLDDLVGYGLFEYVGEGAQSEYKLTAAGIDAAEQITNAR